MHPGKMITAEQRSLVDIGVQSVKLARNRFRVGGSVKRAPAWEKAPHGVLNSGGQWEIAKPMVVWEGNPRGFEDNSGGETPRSRDGGYPGGSDGVPEPASYTGLQAALIRVAQRFRK